jgi:hypothetical protein
VADSSVVDVAAGVVSANSLVEATGADSELEAGAGEGVSTDWDAAVALGRTVDKLGGGTEGATAVVDAAAEPPAKLLANASACWRDCPGTGWPREVHPFSRGVRKLASQEASSVRQWKDMHRSTASIKLVPRAAALHMHFGSFRPQPELPMQLSTQFGKSNCDEDENDDGDGDGDARTVVPNRGIAYRANMTMARLESLMSIVGVNYEASGPLSGPQFSISVHHVRRLDVRFEDGATSSWFFLPISRQ